MQVVKELKRSTGAKKLICFPHSGAYSTAFRPMSQFFGPDWGMIAVDPPGHGTNRAPLVEDIEQMVELYLEALAPHFATPFVLFGHSLGGLVTYRMTQRLEQRGIRPEAVFISAFKPPHLPRKKVTHYGEQEFLEYIISLGGIAPELAQHKELLDLFMPVIRADFKAIESFKHTDLTPLATPTHIFYGDQDQAATAEECQSWSQWAQQVELHKFSGGHMYVMSDAEAVSKKIQTIMIRRELL